MIFPFHFERSTSLPCFKRAGRRGAGLAPSACIRQIPAAKGSRHISERPLCFSGCAFVPPPGFSGPSGFGTSRSPPPPVTGFQHTKWAPGRRPFCFLGFIETPPGRVKGLSPSVPSTVRTVFNTKKLQHAAGRAPFTGSGAGDAKGRAFRAS